MKITALVENTVSGQLAGTLGREHGLSLYIEALGHKILFDMGQTDLFARNAAALGADLAAVDLAVLSHSTPSSPTTTAGSGTSASTPPWRPAPGCALPGTGRSSPPG